MLPIYIINLSSDNKKRDRIKAILNNLGLKYTIVNAINGNQLTKEEINQVYSKNKALKEMKRELKPSEIGCALSHISIYNKITSENINSAIILEDDTVIDHEIHTIENIIESLPEDWDLLLLGHSDTPNGVQSVCKTWISTPTLKKASIAKPLVTVGGAYGYAITQKGARKLINATEVLCRTIDNYTGDYRTSNLYALYPNMIRVDFGLGSAIQQDRENAIKDLRSTSYQTRSKLKNKSSLYRKLSRINKKRREKRKWSFLCLIRIIRHKIRTNKLLLK